MDKLERFEKALSDILNEYDNLGKELEKLRNEGKTKTTKFRELLGKKLVYSMIITIFKRYDLIDKWRSKNYEWNIIKWYIKNTRRRNRKL